jgi:hypothetical protein
MRVLLLAGVLLTLATAAVAQAAEAWKPFAPEGAAIAFEAPNPLLLDREEAASEANDFSRMRGFAGATPEGGLFLYADTGFPRAVLAEKKSDREILDLVIPHIVGQFQIKSQRDLGVQGAAGREFILDKEGVPLRLHIVVRAPWIYAYGVMGRPGQEADLRSPAAERFLASIRLL